MNPFLNSILGGFSCWKLILVIRSLEKLIRTFGNFCLCEFLFIELLIFLYTVKRAHFFIDCSIFFHFRYSSLTAVG